MAILVTAHVPHSLATVTAFERDHPELVAPIVAAAARHQLSHRRFVSDDVVMDLVEYATRADYDAFFAEAGDAIRRAGELLGAQARDTVWEPVA